MELRMIVGPDLNEWIDCTVCYVYPEPVDSRLGFNGLSKLLKELNHEPAMGDAFAFFVKEPKRKRTNRDTALIFPELDGCVKLMRGHEGMQTILEIHDPDAERLKEMIYERAKTVETP